METKKYSRRPFDVDAVKVTRANMDEVAAWCKGEIVDTPATKTAKAERFIQVNVSAPANERQSRAFPGDFVLLLEGGESFKVYTTKAFNKNFVLASEDGKTDSTLTRTASPKKQRAPKKKQPEKAPENGISQEAREALRKMGEGMMKGGQKAAEKVQEAVTPSESTDRSKGVETNYYVDPTTKEVKERKPAPTGKDETPSAPVEAAPTPTDSPDLQVVERPVENTTEPKLEVVDETPEVKADGTKRKFIQKN